MSFGFFRVLCYLLHIYKVYIKYKIAQRGLFVTKLNKTTLFIKVFKKYADNKYVIKNKTNFPPFSPTTITNLLNGTERFLFYCNK